MNPRAAQIYNDASRFTKNLSAADTTVQKALETIDKMTAADAYTKSEVDTLLSGKSDTTHNHDSSYAVIGHNHDSAYAVILHTHDDRYYTESEIATLLGGKSDTSHNHALANLSEKSYNSLTDKPSIPSQYTDALARAAISETITGIDYASATGVFSLATGYVIPTTTEETNWNAAYGWGNHASAGYLTAESDTLATVTARGGVTTNGITIGSVSIGNSSSVGNPLNKQYGYITTPATAKYTQTILDTDGYYKFQRQDTNVLGALFSMPLFIGSEIGESYFTPGRKVGIDSQVTATVDDFTGIDSEFPVHLGMAMNINYNGDVDNYGNGCIDSVFSHRFETYSAPTYKNTSYDVASIVGGIYGSSDCTNDINASGRTLTSVNTGFYSDCVVNAASTLGTHNVYNALLSGILQSNNHTITSGSVTNVGLYIPAGTFVPKVGDANHVILNETEYPITLRHDSSYISFGAGDDANVGPYDGTNLNINPRVVGSGGLKVGDSNSDWVIGQIDATGYGLGYVPSLTPTGNVAGSFGVIVSAYLAQSGSVGGTSTTYSIQSDMSTGKSVNLEYVWGGTDDRLDIDTAVRLFDTDDLTRAINFTIGADTITTNPVFSIYGYMSEDTASKYVSMKVDDTTNTFYIDREDAYITGAYLNMPLEMVGKFRETVTSAPTNNQSMYVDTQYDFATDTAPISIGAYLKNTGSNDWGTTGHGIALWAHAEDTIDGDFFLIASEGKVTGRGNTNYFAQVGYSRFYNADGHAPVGMIVGSRTMVEMKTAEGGTNLAAGTGIGYYSDKIEGGNNNWSFWGNDNIRTNGNLYSYDSTGTHYAYLNHDGTNANYITDKGYIILTPETGKAVMTWSTATGIIPYNTATQTLGGASNTWATGYIDALVTNGTITGFTGYGSASSVASNNSVYNTYKSFISDAINTGTYTLVEQASGGGSSSVPVGAIFRAKVTGGTFNHAVNLLGWGSLDADDVVGTYLGTEGRIDNGKAGCVGHGIAGRTALNAADNTGSVNYAGSFYAEATAGAGTGTNVAIEAHATGGQYNFSGIFGTGTGSGDNQTFRWAGYITDGADVANVDLTVDDTNDELLFGITDSKLDGFAIKLRDASGAAKFHIRDSGGVSVANIDSDGNLTCANFKGYVIQTSSNASSPSDSTTYYTGNLAVSALQTSEGIQRIYIPRAGTIKAAYVYFLHLGTGSNETSTIYIRKNATTDAQISNAVLNDAASTSVSNTSMSLAVTAGDYIEIKWVTPAWATNPTNMYVSATIYIE